jgi:hypothetical protein
MARRGQDAVCLVRCGVLYRRARCTGGSSDGSVLGPKIRRFRSPPERQPYFEGWFSEKMWSTASVL